MKRMTKWRIVGFVLLIAVAAFALLLSLPFLKEGASWEEIPFYLGVAGACIGAGFVWWLACGFSWRRAVWGWGVLLVPVLAHLTLAGGLIMDRFQGGRDAARTTVAGFVEEPIIWPGFDGPVGVKMTLQLEHPPGMTWRLIDPPEIRMGPVLDIPYAKLSATRTNGSGFFKDRYLKTKTGNLAVLKTVLFQKHFETPSPLSEHMTWNASARFGSDGRTELTYFLLPGIVDYLTGENHICLNNRIESLPRCGDGVAVELGCEAKNTVLLSDPVYADGGDLTALWTAWPGMNLSARLTEILRKSSVYQNKPADWTALHKRVEPGGLVRAGYSLCEPGEDSHTARRICYCRETQDAP